MAERVVVNEQYLQDIADSIRAKLKTEDKYKPSEFSSKIDGMNIAPTVTKGFIINKINSNGLVTDASIIGFTEIPNRYLLNVLGKGDGSLFSLIGSNLHLPDNLTSIGQYSFNSCDALTITSLPDSINTINSQAFEDCSKLALTKLPDSLTTIGSKAFYYCTKITISKLPDNLNYIGSNAFRMCTNLKITEIPEGITYIYDGIFRECTGISELTIKGSVTTISGYAFSSCSKLAKLVIPNVTSVPTLSNTSAFSSTPIASGTGYIYVPDTLVDSFKTASNWSTYAAQIKPISELEVTE